METNDQEKAGNSLECFSLEEEHQIDLFSEMFKDVFSSLEEKRSKLVARQNVMVFKHGINWSGYVKKADATSERWSSGLQKQSAQVSISWDRMLNADFAAIEEIKINLTTAIIANFEAAFFRSIEEATKDKEPVPLKLNGDIRPAIIKLWEGVHLGLNDDLTLSEPSLAMDAESLDKLQLRIAELVEKEPEFLDRIQEIKRRKWIDALMEHFENLLRFHLYEEDRIYIEHKLRQLRKIKESQLHESGCDYDQRESA